VAHALICSGAGSSAQVPRNGVLSLGVRVGLSVFVHSRGPLCYGFLFQPALKRDSFGPVFTAMNGRSSTGQLPMSTLEML